MYFFNLNSEIAIVHVLAPGDSGLEGVVEKVYLSCQNDVEIDEEFMRLTKISAKSTKNFCKAHPTLQQIQIPEQLVFLVEFRLILVLQFFLQI